MTRISVSSVKSAAKTSLLLSRNLIGRERSRSHVIDGRYRLQVGEHRLEIGLRHILIHGPWHRRKNIPSVSPVFAGAERLDENIRSPAPETGGFIGREIGGEAHTPASDPSGQIVVGEGSPLIRGNESGWDGIQLFIRGMPR